MCVVVGYLAGQKGPIPKVAHWSLAEGYDYLVYVDKDGLIKTKDGKTGQLVYVGREGNKAVQQAVDLVNPDFGGLILVAEGQYMVYDTINLNKQSVRLVGFGRATFFKLADGVNKDMVVIGRNAINCGVENMNFDGNKANNTSGSVIKVLGYNWRPILKHLTINNAARYGIQFTSETSEYVYEPIIEEVNLYGARSDGINVSWCADLWGANIYVEASGGAGYSTYGVAGTIYHLHTVKNGTYGCFLSEYSHDYRLIGAHFDTNQLHGLWVRGVRQSIIGCFSFNNGQKSAGSYNGMVLENATDCIVKGCVVTDTQATKTQGKGIVEAGTSDYNLIVDNDVRGNIGVGIVKVGANTVVKRNVGFLSETRGTATIPSGATSVTVAHGLAGTPSKVVVTPRGNIGAVWVSSRDASNITINCASAPTSDVVVDWEAEI